MVEANSPKDFSYGVIPIFVNGLGIKEYLLLQNYGGFWGFPKGHPERDETPRDTAIRETREETGLEIDKGTLGSSFYYDYEQSINGVVQFKRVELFPVHIHTKQVSIPTQEIQAYKWALIDEALSLINLPSLKSPLEFIDRNHLS